MAGQAHALVSGDAPMLGLGTRLPFAILALEAFMDQLDAMAIRPIPKPTRY
jgi:hypothetical protein